MNSRKIIAGIGLILAAIGLTGCRRGVVHAQFWPVSSAEWHIDSVFTTCYAITDTATEYQLIVYVRHNECYPYQNMWLFVSDSLHSDTIEFYLADDRGNWLGDKHHGFIEMPVLYEAAKHYTDTGSYYLSVRHAMRDTLLRGITDIGVEVIRNNE